MFVDIEDGTYNMDVAQVEAAITGKTKAILPVHIFGQCVDMDPLNEIAARHGIPVIEDACQAIGATYKGAMAGSLAQAAAFSFFPSKNLGAAGDGGMHHHRRRRAGRSRAASSRLTAPPRSTSTTPSAQNSRLDSLQAGILSVKLPHLDTWNNERRAAAAVYGELLADTPDLVLPKVRDYGDAVYHLYIVKSPKAGGRHGGAQAWRASARRSTTRWRCTSRRSSPRTRRTWSRRSPSPSLATARTFALPCFPGITRGQQEEVVRVVKEALA